MPRLLGKHGSLVISVAVAVAITGLMFWAAGKLSQARWVPGSDARPGAITNDDPRITAATAEARRTWPEFVSLLRDRRPDQRFFVKAKFMDGRTGEWLWVGVDSLSGDTLTGTVDSTPVRVRTVTVGHPVAVKRDDVGDWLFEAPGDRRGGFTIAAMDAIERERQAATQPATPTRRPGK